MPDLRWTDLAHMPGLRALAAKAGVANLSVHSTGSATRCGDALLEFSAGTRVPSGVVPCDLDRPHVRALAEEYAGTPFRPTVGLFGDTTQCLAIGPEAHAAVDGTRRAALAEDSVRADFSCGFVVDDQLYGAAPADRPHIAATLDATIVEQVTHAIPDLVVYVAGISDGPTGTAHLHPLVVYDRRAPLHRLLTSASTGRAGYTQLVDLPATILSRTGAKVPDAFIGRPLTVTSDTVPSLAAFADNDRHARAAANVGGATRNTLALVVVGLLVLFVVRRREARWFGVAVAAAPIVTEMIQLVPWWRWSTTAYAFVIAGATLVIGAIVEALGRRWSLARLLAIPALTAAVLVADQLAGAPLQLSGPLGDNPLVAGRFDGMGNFAFALLAASALLCAGVLAGQARSRAQKLTIAVGLGLVALVVDAAPTLGDDFGGLLSLLPAIAVLALLVAGIAFTRRRIALVVLVTVVVAAGVALLDATRPPARRTHLGRLAADLLHGHSDPVLGRKLRAMLTSFENASLDVLVAVTAAAAVLTRPWKHRPGLDHALVAVAVAGILGTLLNDSGVIVAAGTALAVAPSVVGDTRQTDPA